MLVFTAIVLIVVALVAGFMPKHGMETLIFLMWGGLALSVVVTFLRYLVF